MRVEQALLALLLGVVSAYGERPPLGQSLILVVVDGYGAALLNHSKSESVFGLTELQSQGVKADYLKPVFPSLTVPSWHSLATGLYPESHGFLGNYMYDDSTGKVFESGTGANDSSYLWWKKRPAPFWYTAGKAGIDINCFWFSYCHQSFGDLAVILPKERKTDLDNPDQTEAFPEVFDQMIHRIKKYQPYKKQIFLLRYAGIDAALRQNGAGTEQVESAIAKFDLHIHALQEKMDKAGLFESTNLVVLSEHGLARVVEEEQFYLEECLSDYSNVEMVVNHNSFVQIFTKKGAEDSVFFELKVCDQWLDPGDYDEGGSEPVEIYRARDLPEKYHLTNGRFLGDIILVTKPGTTIVTRELNAVQAKPANADGRMLVADGWSPEADSMWGIFIGRGPAFKVNEKFDAIELVDVYQVLLNIVGLDPAHPHNGSWDRIGPMLTEDWEDRTSQGETTSMTLPVMMATLLASATLRKLFA